MALKCEPLADVPDLPLYPGRVQHWLMAVRAPASWSDSQVTRETKRVLSHWVAAIGSMQLYRITIGEPEGPWETEFEYVVPLRGPTRLVDVYVAYDGPAQFVPWPHFQARRRERIHPTCPMAPTDATILRVYKPIGSANVTNPIEPPDRDIAPGGPSGLGSDLASGLGWAVPLGAVLFVTGAGVYAAWKLDR